MDKLPPEILHRIFILLDLKQRLICLRVCRNWWNVLDKRSLFNSVHISEYTGQLYKFMKRMKELPDRAAQVEVLFVRIQIDTRFNRRELVSIFPNAREIRVFEDQGSSDLEFSHHFKEHIDMTHLKSKVEHIDDHNHCELLFQVIHSNLAGRLKFLRLSLGYGSIAWPVISQLKDLPALTELFLCTLRMKIHYLETIHKNLPSIQVLTLNNVEVEKGDMPSDITPATSVTKLQIFPASFDNAETHIQFYQYVTKKYANITNYQYSDLQLSQYDLNTRQQIFLNGVLGFFKLIGPLRECFFLTIIPDGIDTFEALDAGNSRVKKLDIKLCKGKETLQYLSRSRQSKYIQELNIVRSRLDSIHFLRDMTALTSLKIDSTSHNLPPIQFSDCLAACPPSLKSLSIRSNELIFEQLNIKMKSIENLYIGCGALSTAIVDNILSCFPNLVTFKLQHNVTESIHVVLQSPYLRTVTFSANRFSRSNRSECHKFGFSFTSPNQTDTQYYLCKNTGFWYETSITQYDKIAHLPVLSVESDTDASLKVDFVINVHYGDESLFKRNFFSDIY